MSPGGTNSFAIRLDEVWKVYPMGQQEVHAPRRAVVDYRISELRLQQEMDLLQVDEKGLWHEYNPEVSQ